MKRLLAFAAALALFLFPIAVFAQSETITGEFSEELSALLDGLPETARGEFENVLTESDGLAEVQDRFSFVRLFRDILDALSGAWPSALSLLLRLFGWILIAGIFGQMQNAYVAPQISDAFSFCMTLVFALSLTGSVQSLLTSAANYLSTLTTLSGASAPIAAAVLAASGHLTFAAVTHAALMLIFSLFESAGTFLLMPIVRLSYCLGIVGAVCKEVRVERIAKCVRKIFTVITAFVMLGVSFIIGVQSVLARSADTFSLKTVKFALGNMIPLIGGALSDAISTVNSSLSLIRSAAGGICVAALLMIVLPVIVQLLLHRLVLIVCQSAAEMIGCEREALLIGEVHASLGYILAVVSLTAALFLLVMALVVLMGGAS